MGHGLGFGGKLFASFGVKVEWSRFGVLEDLGA